MAWMMEGVGVLCLCCLFGPLDRYRILSTWQNLAKDEIVELSVPEPVLEPPGHILQVTHPSSTGSLSALSFLTPLI